MAELVGNLGYKTKHGKNYETVKKRLDELNISTSHFKQKQNNKTFTSDEVFCEDSDACQKTVRRLYLALPNIKYECTGCGIGDTWNGNPITLQLDHIDGNNKNNLLSNLRWLCPNCHSQTKTFAGKNVQKRRKSYFCVDCGVKISGQSDRCPKCAALLRRKIERPLKDELESLLNAHNGNFSAIGRIYQVSDNTIRKWCRDYDLPSRTKDYKIIKK